MRGFRPLTRCVIVMAALLTPISACSGGQDPGASPKAVAPGEGSATSRPSREPLGVVPMTLVDGRVHVQLIALGRTSNNSVTGQFRLNNDSSSEISLVRSLYEGGQPLDRRNAASGIGLLDGTGNKLYMPLWTTDGVCLCSDLSARVVPPGGTTDLYAVFPAPPVEVRRLSVVMPLTVPFQDVPIATGPVPPLPDQNIDPATASLAPPRILPVSSTVEGHEQSTDDDGGDRAVRLSSDVLFALNKADLTPRASVLLEGVARQINESTGNTVKVDGHTDTTGNDAINQPLSERRARTVSKRLQSLVTRQGVTFQVTGHGSQDPIASNSTEEGRRKNRRTTVTFTRPLPKPTAPPTSGGEPYTWTQGNPAVLGSATFTPPEAGGLKVEVNGLHRDATGVTVLVWTLRNPAGEPVNITSQFSKFRSLHVSDFGTASGVELTAGKLRYQPLRTSDSGCLCYQFIRSSGKPRIGAGEAATFMDVYKLPPELQTVDVQFPWGMSPGATVTGLTVK